MSAETDHILDAFQAATRAHTALVMCPRWRWRKRAKLRSKRDRLAIEADRRVGAIGKRVAEPLVSILEREQPTT